MPLAGVPFLDETVLYHRPTRTLLGADVVLTADAERFPLRSVAPSGAPVLLFVGRLSRMKGLDLLLAALLWLPVRAAQPIGIRAGRPRKTL